MPDFVLSFQEWFREADFAGNSAATWLAALALFAATMLVVYLAKHLLARRVAELAEQTRSDWDDAIVRALRQTRWWFLLIVALYCGILVLDLPDNIETAAGTFTILALLAQAAIWGNVLIAAIVERHVGRREEDPGRVMMVSALALVGKLIMFAVLLLLALDNLGIDVTALIAGLGVGGIAVALAVQNILGDLLASLSIVFDKPFVLGDFIVVDDQLGTVEKIGLKTTRLRSLTGEQLVMANNDLLQSRIRNYKRMRERRIVFEVGVTYQTTRDKLEKLPQVLREIIEGREQARFDRAHFKSFGASALNFEVVYHVLAPDYNLYMDVQQSINLAICAAFEELGVEFAYPTQTVFLERE